MHTLERQADQLNQAGIEQVPAPDLSWASAPAGHFGLAGRYALMIPGGAPHRLDKRWPVDRFGALAQAMVDAGVAPVLLGTDGDGDVLARIQAICPPARNLAGQTSLEEIAVLAGDAVCAVGNDTGPMHLTAVAGCRSVVLYSHASDPDLCGQRGREVAILRAEPLNSLAVEEVARACALTGG
jgi:ADP-heptose:LPS heptosyltransferase